MYMAWFMSDVQLVGTTILIIIFQFNCCCAGSMMINSSLIMPFNKRTTKITS